MDRKADPKQEEAEGLQANGELIGSSSMDVPDLGGRGGTLGSGYFDAAGNWQTYDVASNVEEPTTSRYCAYYCTYFCTHYCTNYCTYYCSLMWEGQHSMFESNRWPGTLGAQACTLLL